MKAKTLSAGLAAGQPIPESAETETASARDRVIAAGANWCQFTHGHASEKATLHAARQVLSILRDERFAKYLMPDTNIVDGGKLFISLLVELNELQKELQ